MPSRGRVSPLVLRLLAGLCLPFSSIGVIVRAAPLDPNDPSFPKISTALSPADGVITINTDTATITGAVNFTGFILDQGSILQNGVIDYGREIAVFDFPNINISAGVGISIVGSRPLALLSRGPLTIAPTLSLDGGAGIGTLGGAGGAGGVAGGAGGLIGAFGSGPGRGSAVIVDNFDGGGGAFGGNAGPGEVSSVAGISYGDILSRLQGGSSASGARNLEHSNAGGGGGGGGGLELGAVGLITLGGALSADGGNGGLGAYYGGGGSGGGLLVHGSGLTLGGSVSAKGGNGGAGGGGGGGGRLAIAIDSLTASQYFSMLGTISVNGGTATLASRRGRAGVIGIQAGQMSVSAGQSISFGMISTGQTGPLDPRLSFTMRDLNIAAGGSATASTAGVLGSSGLLAVNGTLLLGSNSQSVGILSGSGRMQIGSGASLTFGNGNVASNFSGTIDGGGSILKAGTGEFTLTGNARINATLTLGGGTLTISSANATIGSTIINSSARPITIWNASTATFGGPLATTGSVTVAGGSKAIFNSTFSTSTGTTGTGAVQVNGALVAGVGAASVGFGGDVGFGSLSSTKIEIGGLTSGTQRDMVSIAGAATLAGEIRVGLINGFAPDPGTSFTIMTFGSRSGDINVFAAPGNSGLGLTRSYTATGLNITVNPLKMADANYDGIVDAGDLSRMAQSWQSSGTWVNGDFNNDHFVDVRDLYILAVNWLTALPAAPLSEAIDELGLPAIEVPEPNAAAFALFALLFLPRRTRLLAVPRPPA